MRARPMSWRRWAGSTARMWVSPLVLRVHAGADPPDRDAVQHHDVHVLGFGIQDPGEVVVLAFLPAIRVEGVVDEARDVLLHQRETGAQDRSNNSRRTDRWSNV